VHFDTQCIGIGADQFFPKEESFWQTLEAKE